MYCWSLYCSCLAAQLDNPNSLLWRQQNREFRIIIFKSEQVAHFSVASLPHMHSLHTPPQPRIKTNNFHGRNSYCMVQLIKGRVSSQHLNLIPYSLCTSHLLEFDSSLCCPSCQQDCTQSSTQRREIQMHAEGAVGSDSLSNLALPERKVQANEGAVVASSGKPAALFLFLRSKYWVKTWRSFYLHLPLTAPCSALAHDVGKQLDRLKPCLERGAITRYNGRWYNHHFTYTRRRYNPIWPKQK